MSTIPRRLPSLLAAAAAAVVGFLVPADQIEPQPADLVTQGRQALVPAVYLNLGLAHKRNRQPAEARAAREKGRRLYPSAPEAQAIERELRSL